MAEFERSLRMEAPPDAVLAFVSDVRNLPRYVPTTREAQSQGPERVHVGATSRATTTTQTAT